MRSPDWMILALLFAVTMAVYAPTARFEFVYFDDDRYILRNERIRAGLSGENIRWAFTTFALVNWHPLTWLSYLSDVQIFGLNSASPAGIDARGFLLTNVALHTANTMLLFIVLRATTGASWRSSLVAALFALHPLRVESVAWISERKDVLSTFFGLGHRRERVPRRPLHLLSTHRAVPHHCMEHSTAAKRRGTGRGRDDRVGGAHSAEHPDLAAIAALAQQPDPLRAHDLGHRATSWHEDELRRRADGFRRL